MKKLYRTLALIMIPLFLLRLYDTVFNIDPKTGYFKNGISIFYILSLTVIAAAFIWLYIKNKKTAININEPSPNGLTGIAFGICAVFSATASALLLLGVFRRTELRYIFMNKKNLYLQRIIDTHFRIEFWLGLAGIAAAAWFVFAAFRFFKNGSLSGNPVFCAIPVIWLCMRALSDFSLSPVNPNNTIVLISLLSDIILALFYLRFLRFVSLGYPAGEAKKHVPYAFLAFVFVVSLKAPLAVIAASLSLANAFLIGTDIFAAIAAFTATDLLIGEV